MVQAARSGVQNIVEGSQASATSSKIEMKLTSIARASQEELLRDYENFLTHNGLVLWNHNDPHRKELSKARCRNVEQVAQWINAVSQRDKRPLAEVAANAAHTLIGIASYLLDRQMTAQSNSFLEKGGFTERMYHMRKNNRDNDSNGKGNGRNRPNGQSC